MADSFMITNPGFTTRGWSGAALLTSLVLLSAPVSSARAQVVEAVPAEGFELQDTHDCVIYPSLVSDLGSSATGLLSRVPVDRGDAVRAGDVVAELESAAEQAAVRLARSRAESTVEVELRDAGASFAERRQRRSASLFDQDIVSDSDMDERETEATIGRIQLRQAEEDLEIARTELTRAEELLSRRTIRSPFDGVVVERYKGVGELVENKPVVRVARLDPLHVEVIVPIEVVDRLRIGASALISLEERTGPPWTALVHRIDPVADVASGTYGVQLVLPNPDRAIPAGRRCTLTFDNGPEPLTPAFASADVTGDGISSSIHPTLGAASTRSSSRDASAAIDDSPDSDSTSPASAIADDAEAVGHPDPDPDHALASVATSLDRTNGGKHCRWLGPYSDRARAEVVESTLRSDGLDVAMVERSGKVFGAIVVSARQRNQAQTQVLFERLRDAGFDDLYLMKGESAGRIALGAFEQREAAERRVTALTNQGFEAGLRPWHRTKRGFYIAIRTSADDRLADAVIDVPLFSLSDDVDTGESDCNAQFSS